MNEVDISLGRLFKIWWAIQWRAALMGLLFFAVCIFLWRAFTWPALLSSWAPAPSVYGVVALLGILIGIPFGMLAVRWFLSVSYSDFKIQLLGRERREPPPFRIEPRIGNIADGRSRARPIASHRPVGATSVNKVRDYPPLLEAQGP